MPARAEGRPITPVVEVVGEADEEEADEARRRAPFVSVAQVPEDPGPATTLAEVLEPVPGVRVRRLGGPGAPSAVSVRGSTPSQVQVFLDGVPLDRAAFDVVDLSELPLGALERVEVHRGGVPPTLGGGAVGGAVHLRSRGPAPGGAVRHEVAAGGGSFATRSLDAARAAPLGPLRYRLSLHYRGTEGDFPYYDDQGTPYNRPDDRTEERRNNDSDSGAAVLRAALDAAGARWSLLGLAAGRTRGLPGPSHPQSLRSRAGSLRGLVDVQGVFPRIPSARADLTVGLHTSWLAERLSDPEAELGKGRPDTDDRTRQAGLRLRLDAGVGTSHALQVALQGGYEGFQHGERGGEAGPVERRWTLAWMLADDLFLLGDRLTLSAAVRTDVALSRFSPSEASGGGPGDPSVDVLPSPRLGARLRLADGLHVKANAGRYHRQPAFYELFGRRAMLSGNHELRPERALNADVGLQLERPVLGPLRRVWLEVAAFVSELDDVVVFLPNSQSALVAHNLAEAKAAGVELDAAVSWPAPGLTVAGSWTLLDTENLSPAPSELGRALPGRARHDASLRTTWRWGPVELGHRLTHLSGVFLDTPNFKPLPPRHLHDVYAAWRPAARWRVTVEVGNLLDQRVEEVELLPRTSAAQHQTAPAAISDLARWPLPGRALYASIRWSDG